MLYNGTHSTRTFDAAGQCVVLNRPVSRQCTNCETRLSRASVPTTTYDLSEWPTFPSYSSFDQVLQKGRQTPGTKLSLGHNSASFLPYAGRLGSG